MSQIAIKSKLSSPEWEREMFRIKKAELIQLFLKPALAKVSAADTFVLHVEYALNIGGEDMDQHIKEQIDRIVSEFKQTLNQ